MRQVHAWVEVCLCYAVMDLSSLKLHQNLAEKDGLHNLENAATKKNRRVVADPPVRLSILPMILYFTLRWVVNGSQTWIAGWI